MHTIIFICLTAGINPLDMKLTAFRGRQILEETEFLLDEFNLIRQRDTSHSWVTYKYKHEDKSNQV